MREVTGIPFISKRAPETHKGTYGHLLVLGGSLGLTGAPAMAAQAALRTGSGLVTCAIPNHVNPILEIKLTEAMTWPLPADSAGCLTEQALRIIKAGSDRFASMVVGPGLGRHERSIRFAGDLLQGTELPAVVDADALKAFLGGRPAGANFVLTPHPGEFAPLAGLSIPEVQKDRRRHASEFVQARGGVLVLKGHQTIVVDKERFYVNRSGNPGMATGGAGDVLSGIIGSLLGQGFKPFSAAVLGVYLHGRAGDLACRSLGEESLIAGDITHYLPEAIRERKK